MCRTSCCCHPRKMYTGKFKDDWKKLISLFLISAIFFISGIGLMSDETSLIGFLFYPTGKLLVISMPLLFIIFSTLWIIRACCCMGEASEGFFYPDIKLEQRNIELKNIEQSEIEELIAEIGKQRNITKEQINAYAASFFGEDIDTREAFYRCSEQ